MLFAGIQKLTLLDYPEKTACTLFTYGCNFRCSFCHNASLVTQADNSLISEDEVLSFLDKRRGLLDAVCITGGEPTLHKDLPEFIRKVKAMGYLVKLDTNGTKPDTVKYLLDEKLLDYAAMDIKNSPSRYEETVAVKTFDITPVLNSIELFEKSSISHEFRTTVTKELHSEKDIREILNLFNKETPYFLQQFKDGENLIEKGNTPWNDTELRSLADILKNEGHNVTARGI